MTPAHCRRPRDLPQTIVEIRQRLPGRAGSQDVEAQSAMPAPSLALLSGRRHDLEGQRQGPSDVSLSGNGKPTGGDLPMDAVVETALAKRSQEPLGQLLAGSDAGHQPRRPPVEAIDFRVLAFQQPLTEVLELWDAGGAIAGKHQARALGCGMLAIR